MLKNIDIGMVAVITDLIIPFFLYKALQSHLTLIAGLVFALVIIIRILIAAGLRKHA